MTLSQIEAEARTLLLQRRRSLSPQPAPAPTPVTSGASWTEDEAAREPVGDEVREEIAAIDEALGRIATGSYGTCLACGGPLGLQRIRAIPEARYCVACSGSEVLAE
jgi:DnaK suppressor protein